MGTYTSDKVPVPVGLDEVGLRLGLQRLPAEALADYRQRLLLEVRDPASVDEESFFKGIGRKIGRLDQPIFEIDLVLDAGGEPLAADPYIEVTSTFFRAYDDYAANKIDIEVFFYDRANGYWLADLNTALAASTYFSTTVLDAYAPYLKSSNLRSSNNRKFQGSLSLPRSYQNRIAHAYVSKIFFTNLTAFQVEKTSLAEVVAEGDYYVDYTNGVLFSQTTQSGICSYSYAEFPYRLHWSSVRGVAFDDDDLKYIHQDLLVSDETGLEERAVLSSEGARIVNQVLKAHPLSWGE